MVTGTQLYIITYGSQVGQLKVSVEYLQDVTSTRTTHLHTKTHTLLQKKKAVHDLALDREQTQYLDHNYLFGLHVKLTKLSENVQISCLGHCRQQGNTDPFLTGWQMDLTYQKVTI